VDDKGSLLARPATADGGMSGNQDDMRSSFEMAQARKIEDLLARTLGYGKVRAQVSADLDFDKITTSSEIFDPDSQVIRSTQTSSEDSSSADGGSDAVTITNNLPGNSSLAGGGAGSSNKNTRSEETVNYEINKTVRNQVRESGQVKRLSVAVVVDGAYAAAADGTQTYQPRSAEEMEKIKALVRSAVNFDANRGDTVEVVNMQFAQSEAAQASGGGGEMVMGVPKVDLMRMAETLILAIIGLLVVLLIVRPILRRIFDSASIAEAAEQQQLLSSGGYSATATPQIAPPTGGSLNRSAPLESSIEQESEIEKMIDISRVDGRVRASSLRKVGEIVDKHPEEAVAILRNWIYQESR
jgi:flagellar M-ring protein FliF